jgi:hypothetical protein
MANKKGGGALNSLFREREGEGERERERDDGEVNGFIMAEIER